MSLELEASKTGRGFAIVKFKDRYSTNCSLQKSSLASDDAVWLGVHLPEPQIMARDAVLLGLPTHGQTAGWVPYEIPPQVMIPTRMHLTREQVAELIPLLQHFADTGELPTLTEPEPTHD